MMHIHFRHVVRDLAWAGAVVSAAMLVAGLGSGVRVFAAGTNAGALQVLTGPSFPTVGQPLTSGDADDRFLLQPPPAAVCSGDSATGGYRIQSFMVPASVDPATLTFDSIGPIPNDVGANLRQPLYAQGTGYIDGNTAIGTGVLTGIPAFDFGVFGGADGSQLAPPGTYTIGLACTLGGASATQQDKYWSVQVTFAAAPSGSITFTVDAATPPTTTSTTTTTTTLPPGATTTTTLPPGATSTTTSTSTTTTTIRPVTANVQSSAGATGSGGSGLVSTGSSPLPIVIWAALLLVIGRMTVLLARRLRVAPPEKR